MHLLPSQHKSFPRAGFVAARQRWRQQRAFTLVEMLTVIAIILVLIVSVTAAFNSILQSHSFAQQSQQVADYLEYLRNDAVARKTYVWAGCLNTSTNGRYRLLLGSAYSRDGSSNSSTSNLTAMAKSVAFDDLVLVSWTSLKASTQALWTNTGNASQSVATNTVGITFIVGTQQFSKQTITFTPTGEAMLSGNPAAYDGYTPLIDVSFRQARGLTILPQAEDAGLMIDGATGATIIYRIK